MNLSEIKPAAGSVKKRFRVGRGFGSGNGKTSGRGMNGAGSRSGNSRKIGFEGGQMPIYRRLPKGGFKNINRVEYSALNLDALQLLVETKNITVITPEVLVENGLVSKKSLVKILGRGEINVAIEVTANAFSESAKKAIEDKGGKINVL
jgi:large subunit ribosomal protein L15